jgi:6-phosphogluconolactonase
VSNVELVVREDAEAAARDVARRLARAAAQGKNIVLTGGSTPKRAYELAAELERDWSRARVWWGDERAVPPDDERSNYGMARTALLDRLDAGPAEVHRIRGELGAEAAGAAYEPEVQGTGFDLLLLGIGPDGHVASLFPNAPTLAERERLVVPAKPQLEPMVDRVTLTLPALRSAREIVFLVAGQDKAEAVERAFASEPDESTPASLVRAADGRTTAVLDRAAASRLSA